MKRSVGKNLVLFYENEFPKVFYRHSKKNIAIIGVGGNIADVKRRFKKLLFYFKQNPQIKLLKTAPILKNPPFGYKNQPDFFNTLLLVDTKLSPLALLQRLLYIEKRFKRVRTFKNAPRTLDLDIIFYSDKIIKKPKLIIPHPFWESRESVIIPLRFLGEFR